ncbi:MAG: serine/threonine protein kinase, partial [Kofleriaceae bacterium]|nr:serine/threonine protein kinase [Kofleriaceae bacterium]
LGRFLVLDRLGAGASGVVYSAYDPQLDRKVAIKLLRLGGEHAQQRARLAREAKAMARVHSDNVVSVYEQGTTNTQQLFVVMQLVDGTTLSEYLVKEKPGVDKIIEVLLAAGDGLAEAHKVSLVHRDFKPDNVLIDKEGRVRVADFGLAQNCSQDAEHRGLTGTESLALTQTGAMVGTPDYMAPEVLQGGSADMHSDQYSYAVTLYHSLCGRLPHSATTIPELLKSVGTIPPLVPPTGAMPGWLWRIVQRALSTKPEERYPSVEALLRDIRKRLARRRTGPLYVGGALICIVAGVMLFRVGSDKTTEVCTGAQVEFEATWNTATEFSLKQALSPAGKPRHQETFERAQTLFDEYREEWTETHRHVCMATQRGEQNTTTLSMRMRCLDRRRSEVGALLEVLSQPESMLSDKAVRAITELTPSTVCNNVERLQQSSTIPEDPRDARSLEKLEKQLDVAIQLRIVGQYEKGLNAALEVMTAAEALKYEPFVSEARVVYGDLQVRMGAYEKAAASLRLAFSEGLGSGNDRAATQAAIRSIGLTGFRLRQATEAKRWGWLAGTMLARLGEDLRLEAMLASNLGNVAFANQNYVLASDYFRQAVDTYIQAHDENHLTVGYARTNLGATERLQGNFDEATKQLLMAVSNIEMNLGTEHPDLGRVYNSIGNLYLGRKDYKQSEKFHRKALLLKEKSLGAGHTSIAHSCNNLADVLIEQGKYQEAKALFERAYSIWSDNHGEQHRLVSLAQRGIAQCMLALGDSAGASGILEEVLSTQVKLEITGTEQGVTRFLLAQSLWPESEARSRALALANESIPMFDKAGESWKAKATQWLGRREK